jgi:hypothetical protein
MILRKTYKFLGWKENGCLANVKPEFKPHYQEERERRERRERKRREERGDRDINPENPIWCMVFWPLFSYLLLPL